MGTVNNQITHENGQLLTACCPKPFFIVMLLPISAQGLSAVSLEDPS